MLERRSLPLIALVCSASLSGSLASAAPTSSTHHRPAAQEPRALSSSSKPTAKPSPNSKAAEADADAGADKAIGPERRRTAEALYSTGVNAYSRGHYKEAIDAFRAADALLPSAALSFNTALAYEKLLDHAQALRCYRDYLRRAPEADNAPRVQKRVRDIEALLAARGVQQISIFSKPDGATVTIDGTPRGITPFTGELPPGKHQLKLSLRGHEELQAPVDLPGDHAIDARFELEPANPDRRRDSAALVPDAGSRRTSRSKPEQRSPKADSTSPWPWILMGAGGASLLTAGGFEVARRSAQSDAREQNTQTGYADALERVDSRQKTARIFLGVGGALTLIGGAVWLFEWKGRRDEQPATQVGFDGQQLFVRYGGKL